MNINDLLDKVFSGISIEEITVDNLKAKLSDKKIDVNQMLEILRIKEEAQVKQVKTLKEKAKSVSEKAVSLKNKLGGSNPKYQKITGFLKTCVGIQNPTLEQKMNFLKLFHAYRRAAQFTQLFYKDRSKLKGSVESSVINDMLEINTQGLSALYWGFEEIDKVREALIQDFGLAIEKDFGDYKTAYIPLQNETDKKAKTETPKEPEKIESLLVAVTDKK